MIIGGELMRGAAGFAGEPGHMVVDPNGPPLPVRAAGLLGALRLGQRARPARRRDAAEAGQADGVVALAGGDPEDGAGRARHPGRGRRRRRGARGAGREFAWWVALGISNLENLLDPEVVVIGGGLAEAGELLLAPTRAAYATLVLGYEHRPPVRIVGAELGADAGAIGAGLLVLDTLRPWPPT